MIINLEMEPSPEDMTTRNPPCLLGLAPRSGLPMLTATMRDGIWNPAPGTVKRHFGEVVAHEAQRNCPRLLRLTERG